MKTARKKHLIRLLVLQAVLAAALLVSVYLLKAPVRFSVIVYGAAVAILFVLYFALTYAGNRGLLPRGIPIKPLRPTSRPQAVSGEFYFGDAADHKPPTGKDRVIDDYIETTRHLIQTERYEDAEEILKKALDVDPVNSRLLNYLGICLSRTARYDEAVKVYETCIEQDYDNASAHFNLAVALENAERVGAAVAQYQRYLKVGAIVGEPEDMLARAEDRLRCLRG